MSQVINEDVLWHAAEILRDKVPPEDYKNVVLGLVFLKYVSDKYTAKYDKLKKEGNEHDDDYYISDHIFIVPEKANWKYISEHSKQADLGQIIDNAFVELEKKNGQLKGILPKTYSKSELDKQALGEIVDYFTNNLNMNDADGDFFGQVYEFYIGAFAQHVASKGGEYFTPKSIVELMTELLEPYKGRVYDPCCGSGGMFIQCSKFVKKHQENVDSISIFGQEVNPGNWKMAKMNLAIHGLEGNLGDKNADSFTDDLHKNLKADFIMANPPYNKKNYWKPQLEGDSRWIFGSPNQKNANYAWLSLMCAKLSPNGKATILMPNSATTSEDKDDYKLRKEMIEKNKIEAIIQLPNKLFSNVTIPVQCWVLNNNKQNSDFLFINAENLGKLKDRRTKILEESDISKIVKTYKEFLNNNFSNEPGFAKKASLEEIKQNDYSLNPGLYVEIKSEKLPPEEINKKIKEYYNELLNLIKEGEKLEEKVKENLQKEIK